ncbi:C-type mannose receptor 2-like [Branchiostoma floridae x Branchiostoma belcheri]
MGGEYRIRATLMLLVFVLWLWIGNSALTVKQTDHLKDRLVRLKTKVEGVNLKVAQTTGTFNNMAERVWSQTCPDGWRRNQRSCYLLVDTPKTWRDARDACHQLEADLASLTTAEEQTYMGTQVDATYWFGLSDIVAEDAWQWADGTGYDPAVTNWNSHEPNNMGDEDCAEIGSHGGWNDQQCTHMQGYICEKRTVWSPACSDGWRRNQRSCYLLVDTPKTWRDARDACHQLQANLASLTTTEEQTYMGTQVDATYWFGLSDIVAEDAWQWADGTGYDPAVTNWNSDEPNNMGDEDCAEIGSDGGWNDQQCTKMQGYICEKRTVWSPACSDGWRRNQRSCYLLVDTPKTWRDARDACHLLRADLASLTTTEEQTYMGTQVGATYWFGLSDIVAEDAWQWADGTGYDPAVT